MTDFKIGDKVKSKDGILQGYVSHVDKGQLFGKPIPEIHVHIGDGVKINFPATYWEKICE